MIDDFIALSRVLTGVEDLDRRLGKMYLDRLVSSPFQPQLAEILERFRGLKKGDKLLDQVKAKIVEVDDLNPAVCQIVLLWFTSSMLDPSAPAIPLTLKFGTQDEYFSGLAWKLMGAHVPGLSGGYFGHWRYRPENEPK